MSDSTAKCWGDNAYGMLGDGTTSSRLSPVVVSGISTATQVVAGSYSSCALLGDGTVKCWGLNAYGQLGDGTFTNRTSPVAVSGVSTATQITAGRYHSCALLTDGKVKCWGHNAGGKLGDGTTTTSTSPVAVSGISTATQISAGVDHTCAVLAGGTVKCWGSGSVGELGDGTQNGSYTPVTVVGITTATQVSAGGYHTCAVLTGGTVKCWGHNTYGQLGDTTTTIRTSPVSVSGITTGVQVSAGDAHTCAALAGGSVKCWGNNVRGGIGQPPCAPGLYYPSCSAGQVLSSSTPVTVSGVSAATQVSAGGAHTCARLNGGAVNCWGYGGYGQLGNGSNADSIAPVVAIAGGPVDSTAPSTPGSFTGVPSSPTNQTGATIGFTLGESGGTVECRVDSGSWGSCTSVSGTSGSHTVSGLADGGHTVSVRHTDGAGNVSSVGTSASWTVDTTAPSAPVLSGAPSGSVSSTSATISFTAEDGATFTCSLDGGAYAACSSPRSLTGLSVGAHTFSVKASDAAGNTSLAETASWTVTAAVAPVSAPTILTPAAGTKTVVRATVDGKGTWVMKLAPLFSTGGDTRAAAQILTVQVAVDSAGRPVSAKPSDSQPLPKVASYINGISQWTVSGDVARTSVAVPVWVRVGNRAGKWTGWVKLTPWLWQGL